MKLRGMRACSSQVPLLHDALEWEAIVEGRSHGSPPSVEQQQQQQQQRQALYALKQLDPIGHVWAGEGGDGGVLPAHAVVENRTVAAGGLGEGVFNQLRHLRSNSKTYTKEGKMLLPIGKAPRRGREHSQSSRQSVRKSFRSPPARPPTPE